MTDERPEFTFTSSLWLYVPDGSWHFLDLPFEVTDEIEDLVGPRGGFGSVRVEVTIGGSTWKTSVFPDSKRKTFILPVKKAVRTAEGLEEGSSCGVTLRLV